MQSRVLKSQHGEYEIPQWDGVNRSGFRPISDRVMIMPARVKEKTTGGVILTEDSNFRHNAAATHGIIIALGPEAFSLTMENKPYLGDKPQVGAHVYFEKFAGQLLQGDDGVEYRVLSSANIGAEAYKEPANV